jgi:hypothetical protein
MGFLGIISHGLVPMSVFSEWLGTSLGALDAVNFSSPKPIPAQNAMQFGEWSLIDNVRPVMRWPFWAVRGNAVFDRAGRSL